MSAEPITLLLPTAGRPELLRTALTSVADQTLVSHISKVVISENTSNEASRAIAAEFATRLPIEYALRRPTLSPFAHGHALFAAAPTEGLVAVLHDDDWWGPTHLADSLARIEAYPDAVASYAGFYEVASETALLKCDTNIMFWFGGNYPPLRAVWLLDECSVLLSCLLGTPGRYSTLLARAAAFHAAVAVTFREANPYDNDRRLLLEFARLGKIAFSPIPSVFIRLHPQQDSQSYAYAEHVRHMRATTMYALARIDSLGLDLAAELDRRLRTCPAPALPALLAALGQVYCAELLVERHLAPPALQAYHERMTAKPNWRYHAGRLIPPVLLDAWARRL
jgi:hypothetical protein